MRTKAFLPAGVALVALLVSLAPLAAADDDDVELAASGTVIPGPPVVPTIIEEEENLCVFEVIGLAFGLKGTILDGSATADITVVQEAPCDVPFAPATFEGHGTYHGDVATAHGTFDFELEGSIDALGNFQAQLEIEEGTEELADLDGELTFVGPPLGAITYSGQLEFDD